MKRIESTQNELVKRFSKLSLKKYRKAEGLFVIEGKISVRDSIRLLGLEEIEAVLALENEANTLLNEFPLLEEKVIVTSQNILDKISDYDSKSELILVARQRDYNKKINSKLCVYLDRIRDPGNLGTILRTAAAAGFGVLLDDCCDLFNTKVIRSSMSAIASVEIGYVRKNAPDCNDASYILKDYIDSGYRVFAACMDGENIFSICDNSIVPPIIIAIGNEAEGLSEEILCIAEKSVAIPIEGIESLNASLAAGVLMFEFKHRLISRKG